MHIKVSMFRSSPPEVFSKKTLHKYEANPQENNRLEARSQQSRFATLSKSHPRTDAPPRIQNAPAEHLSLGEHLLGDCSCMSKEF